MIHPTNQEVVQSLLASAGRSGFARGPLPTEVAELACFVRLSARANLLASRRILANCEALMGHQVMEQLAKHRRFFKGCTAKHADNFYKLHLARYLAACQQLWQRPWVVVCLAGDGRRFAGNEHFCSTIYHHGEQLACWAPPQVPKGDSQTNCAEAKIVFSISLFFVFAFCNFFKTQKG